MVRLRSMYSEGGEVLVLELQGSADAAALAGPQELPNTSSADAVAHDCDATDGHTHDRAARARQCAQRAVRLRASAGRRWT